MKLLCAGLVLGAAIGLAQTVTSYSDPKAPPAHRVCMTPTDARLVRLGVKGGETLTKESEEWGAKVGAAVRHSIGEAGGELTGDLSPDALKGDEETRQSVLKLRQKYENIAHQFLRKPGDVKKGRYTLGDEVALLPCSREADSIAFVDASGSVKTGGRKTVSILAGGFMGVAEAMPKYRIWIGIVDAKNGELKTLLRVDSFGGKFVADPETALDKPLTSQLKKLHLGP